MAKTPVNVDEDAIRGMIKGDIPRLSVRDASQPSREETDSDEMPPIPKTEAESTLGAIQPTGPTDTSIGESTKPRRRKEPKDYSSAFLKKREPAQKRQTYIGATHFAKITEILAVVASDLSVPTFLDNILSDHLERYRDEINALYAEKFKTPL
jgi:hypothetical protein